MAVNTGFNYPLYIHPSDTPGMTLVTEKLTGTDNYGVWSRAMLIALRDKNKTRFIDGSCRRPSIEQPTSMGTMQCISVILDYELCFEGNLWWNCLCG